MSQFNSIYILLQIYSHIFRSNETNGETFYINMRQFSNLIKIYKTKNDIKPNGDILQKYEIKSIKKNIQRTEQNI